MDPTAQNIHKAHFCIHQLLHVHFNSGPLQSCIEFIKKDMKENEQTNKQDYYLNSTRLSMACSSFVNTYKQL